MFELFGGKEPDARAASEPGTPVSPAPSGGGRDEDTAALVVVAAPANDHGSDSPAQPSVPYEYIHDDGALQVALDQRRGAGIIALDCETSGLDPLRDTIRLIQLATPDHPVLIVDCQTLSAAGWDALRTFLASPMRKLFHHAKFDVAMLRAAGVAVEGPYADTMLAAQLLRGDRSKQEGPFTLAALVRDYLGEDLSKAQQASDWTGTLTPAQLAYAAKDACILLRLWEAMVPDLETAQLTAVAELEFAALPALVEIELAGMKVDRAALTALQQTLADARDAAVTAARAALEAPTLNLQSPPQLLRVLQRRGIPVDGTGKDVLRPLLH